MTSRSNVRGKTLGEQFSKVSVEELQAAANENKPSTSPTVKASMKSISTSRRAQGNTPDLSCYFSTHDYFRLNSIFLTITPDDKCNFRIKILTKKT